MEFDSGDTKGDSATILASSSNEGKENSSHYISDSASDPVDTQKLNDSISLGAKSASQPNDVNCQSHGCASLDSNLHQFENYFQSEIDILKERLSIYAASPNFSSSQGGNSVGANLLKEDQDLKRRLSEIETKYENLKAEAKIIINENKSLDTALRLLNNEFSANYEHSNLHPTLSKGVEAIKRPDNSDTFEPSAHNNQQSNKLPSSGSYGSKEDRSNEEPRSNAENGEVKTKPIVLIGDSIIKHIDPKKLSQRRGHKFSYPGKTAGEIAEVVDNIAVSSDLSHVIIHTETNNRQLNLPSDLLNHVSQKSRTLH